MLKNSFKMQTTVIQIGPDNDEAGRCESPARFSLIKKEMVVDVNTGHLISDEMYERLQEELRENYEPVPEELSLSAQLELMGKEETYVGKEATSKIARWARTKSKLKKRKMNRICCR